MQKLSRKLVHMLAGPGFMLCWPLFRCARYWLPILSGALVCFAHLLRFHLCCSTEPTARLFAAVVPALNIMRYAVAHQIFMCCRGTEYGRLLLVVHHVVAFAVGFS